LGRVRPLPIRQVIDGHMFARDRAPFTAVQSSAFPSTEPLKRCPTTKSKLLQKKSCGVSQSREVVDGQQENIEDSSLPWKGRGTRPNPINQAVDAQPARDFPGLLKRNYRPARS
jgi:hypothetical protein